jgi:type III pantothenate kinase
MLLAIDVGNSNIVIGAMDGEVPRWRWRLSSETRTTDELGMLLLQLLSHRGLTAADISGVCLCCVVPSVLYTVQKAIRRYLGQEALTVGSGVRTGMRVRVDNPREVGADRIVNAVAAFERFGGPLVVVDFGTATTFDCIGVRGDYLGGAIAPGLKISADALFDRTARLPRVELAEPAETIGTNTVSSMQSGLYWGYVGLVQELARRCKDELASADGPPPRCIATGGMANLIGRACTEVDEVDDALTLRGLVLVYERNQRRRPAGRST